MTSITVWYFELVVGKGTMGDFSVSYFHYIARPSKEITSFFGSENVTLLLTFILDVTRFRVKKHKATVNDLIIISAVGRAVHTFLVAAP